MQRAFSRFAKNDYAKYPFLKAATKYMKIPDLKIQDLTDPGFESILKRAEERLEEAILYTIVSRNPQHDEDIEIMSFPVAIMLAVATQNSFIKKRYALAEAKQAYQDLKDEPTEKILELAQNFGWKLTTGETTAIPSGFTLHFADYLRNTIHLRDSKWKLVNRNLSQGNVCIGKDETARLLSEEVRRHIEQRTEQEDLPKFPAKITKIAEKLKKLSADKIGKTELEEFPQTIAQEAFPPCIQALYQSFSSGRHLSHIGRFTLTSFLISIGMPSEKVIELFQSISDFNERMTRYQVEHIAGERGSRTKYKTPTCDTLRTHGVCTNPDALCQNMRNPLAYYKRNLHIQTRSG